MDKKTDIGFKIYHILLYVILAVMLTDVVLTFLVDDTLQGIVKTGFFLIVAAVVVYVKKALAETVRERILTNAVDLGNEFQQYMNQWEYPYALFGSNLRVIWYNEAFRKLVKYEDCIGKSLEELSIKWGSEKPDWDPLCKMIEMEDHYFRALMSQIRLRDKGSYHVDLKSYTEVYSLSLQDVTREIKLEQENIDQQTVVALLYLDNYDQIISGVDDNRRPLMEAMIFRKLSDLSSELGGILTRLENDRFFLVFPRKNLEKLYANKFRILEDMKKLNMGNKFPVTLSIGVGVDKEIETARRYARSSVDLAMGRGGDQAVVKSQETQKFFGGMTNTSENNTRVRARLIAYALKELITGCDNVLVMGHANPDLDSFGAALGMYRGVLELKKPAHIVMSEDKHAAVDYLYRRVKEDKEYSDILINQKQAEEQMGPNTLLILVDVNRRVIAQFPELVDKARNIAVIDHHRTSADSVEGAGVSYVEPFASSASEMVTELLQYMVENLTMRSIEADGLFAGIALDTKNFTVKTGVRTFDAASYLRRRGADSVRVRKMFKNDMGDYKAKAEVVRSAEIIGESIAVAAWTSNLPNASTVAAQAADELLDVHGIQASFVMTEIDKGQVNFSARSLGEVNVQLIMEELGGGGHLSMAGAQLKDATLESARRRLEDAIEKVLDIKLRKEE
ncbi:MAG: DHH family phosphoesterase [Firmicutes bacterium]|nr:DHH family phosphoesterase [Bacillota bacterium]